MFNINQHTELSTFECLLFMPWNGQLRFRLVRIEGKPFQAFLISDPAYDNRLFEAFNVFDGETNLEENKRPITMQEFVVCKIEEYLRVVYDQTPYNVTKNKIIEIIQNGEYEIPFSDKGFSVSYIRHWEKDKWTNTTSIASKKNKQKEAGKKEDAYTAKLIMVKVQNNSLPFERIIRNLNLIGQYRNLYDIPDEYEECKINLGFERGFNTICNLTTGDTVGKFDRFSDLHSRLYQEVISLSMIEQGTLI